MRSLTVLFLSLLSSVVIAQKSATISGRILDENENPVSNVSVIILGKSKGTSASDSGTFTIKVASNKALALVFSHTGYLASQKNFFLSAGETEFITVKLSAEGKILESVVISDNRERKENSFIKINPKNALSLPGTVGGVEGLIKTLVGSNNELTSQYNVRGGNYDENLVYINDFEIYRPYLVSSGQQEGLSLINPELAKNVNFYTGGFQSKYGDKLSSVLDIQYKKPTTFSGTAYISLLEQGMHVEGTEKKNNISYLLGIRNKSNKNLLSNQPTQGSYIPSSSDVQAYVTYKLNQRLQFELLGIYSTSRFSFFPESAKKTSSVFSPFFTANLGLDIYFEGQEKDNYSSSLIGATMVHTPNRALRLKWMLSRFTDEENENFDIAGAYLFGNRDFDNTSTTFGEIVNPLGAGYYQNYARNKLNIDIWKAGHKGSLEKGKHFIQWGNNIEQVKIRDYLRQFEYQDSAGYSLPNRNDSLSLSNYQNNSIALTIHKYSGYIQDNIHLSGTNKDISIQAGVRYNYNDLNKEFLISPRIQASWKPGGKKDLVFKLAAGLYQQPPFYRELRSYDGTVNTAIRAQKSMQVVAGADYNLTAKGMRHLRITTELYYKAIKNVVPYDIDNVKIRYLGNNDAKAYAAGVEIRLFSELVKDAESWVSFGLMRTEEDLANDKYFLYKNAAGEIINAGSTDKTVVDSLQKDVGYIRRPSDRLITMGLFLQDYLSTNKNFKVHMNMLYGSNMSYNIPNSVRYRNALIIEPYIRLDLGFSALLLSERAVRRSHSPFRNFENIWLSFEILNIIDRPNTISYQLIKDFANNTFAIPNRLTPRLANLKMIARF
ncbi:MAG: TonB-dependent receptor [Ferruginibacter sp.]